MRSKIMKNLPEKIYLNFGDLTEEEYNETDFHDLFSEEVTWSEDDVQGRNAEYVRKDAFIEKACEFLDGCIPDYIDLEHANVDTFMNVDNKRFIEDFKKYVEE